MSYQGSEDIPRQGSNSLQRGPFGAPVPEDDPQVIAMRAIGFHNAVEVISHHFPSGFVVSLFITANMVIDNSGYCEPPTRNTVVALIIIHSLLAFMSRFLDRYQASNNQRYYVILMPFNPPFSPTLPSEEDKDLVADNYYYTMTDFMGALAAAILVPALSVTQQPVIHCL